MAIDQAVAQPDQNLAQAPVTPPAAPPTAAADDFSNVKLDMSKSISVPQFQPPPAAQDFSNVKLDMSKSIPVPAPPSLGRFQGVAELGRGVKKAVLGENTALGAPAQKEFVAEGSGVSDVLHGNIKQGLKEIWASEAPHVIQGSPIEKIIQSIVHDFQGSVPPEQVADYNHRKATAQPFVNAAQFIDKNAHPVLK